ncbi:hypothetical protein [Ramlibacter sp. WS9]|uniref:hypothetical protein n=1 Tax=Ramlibacter sp. WS9 TaxID=1882741 RepID=UPI0011424A4F|nr:hypothetical protein [Ramlibacter sp. WS9]ROZ79582.1 hypothetical protein EEB15_01330 [Ramlibacter sp. WS9]
MKLISRVVPLVSSALLAVGLAGCAAPQKSNAHAHSDTGSMDMQAMCEMHKKMMSGKPPAEQQAMMQEHMKSMAPEMRQRAQAMHEKCK